MNLYLVTLNVCVCVCVCCSSFVQQNTSQPSLQQKGEHPLIPVLLPSLDPTEGEAERAATRVTRENLPHTLLGPSHKVLGRETDWV